jgi:hypothetical protein
MWILLCEKIGKNGGLNVLQNSKRGIASVPLCDEESRRKQELDRGVSPAIPSTAASQKQAQTKTPRSSWRLFLIIEGV